MERERFEELVHQAVESLPQEFLESLENIEVLVEDYPTAHQLSKSKIKGNYILLGLYEGVPRTRRSSHYGMVLPDKITIFQKAVESKCRNKEDAIVVEIGRVVRHEIAHHFGIDDDRLRELGR
jgi:predicted Zn-dependent protease with MMP-like domain